MSLDSALDAARPGAVPRSGAQGAVPRSENCKHEGPPHAPGPAQQSNENTATVVQLGSGAPPGPRAVGVALRSGDFPYCAMAEP